MIRYSSVSSKKHAVEHDPITDRKGVFLRAYRQASSERVRFRDEKKFNTRWLIVKVWFGIHTSVIPRRQGVNNTYIVIENHNTIYPIEWLYIILIGIGFVIDRPTTTLRYQYFSAKFPKKKKKIIIVWTISFLITYRRGEGG